MESDTNDYRKQLVGIYHRLFSMMVYLYDAGYQIALEDEWKDLKYSDGTSMKLPFEMDYLQTVEDEMVQMIVKMIRIIEEGYSQIRFANNLSEKELYGVESIDDEESDDEDVDEELEFDDDLEFPEDEELYEELKAACISEPDYFREACNFIPFLYCDVVLLSGRKFDSEIVERFKANYWNGTIKLKSDDFNVHFLIDMLNRLIRTMTGTIDDFQNDPD
jgi:hypothetical protein